MNIRIPTDEDGLVGRKCPDETCSPGYFKVKIGTGITEGYVKAFCPYCRHEGDPGDFQTKGQQDYATRVLRQQVQKELGRMIEKSLGLGSSRKKTFGGGMFSLEMQYKPGRIRPVGRLWEEELRRDITCPGCGLEHAVFGLATWCPDCASDIFLTHVEQEYGVVKQMLSEIDSRRENLGARVAARDTENALEDVVSIFEAALRHVTRRHLAAQGLEHDQIDVAMRKRVGNGYQSVERASGICRDVLEVELFEGIDDMDTERLKLAFEKRHPITHNLGIVDRKYLERARSGELEGREVRIGVPEVSLAIEISLRVLQTVYRRVFAANGEAGA